MFISKKYPSTLDMNIAPVAATSLMLSAAAALIVEEPMRLPTSAVKKPIHSLTSMDIISTISMAML